MHLFLGEADIPDIVQDTIQHDLSIFMEVGQVSFSADDRILNDFLLFPDSSLLAIGTDGMNHWPMVIDQDGSHLRGSIDKQ